MEGAVQIPAAPRRVLAARGGALGDFIVTLPALAALRRRYPEAALHLLAHPAHAALAAADGLCEGWRSLESAGLAPFFVAGGNPDASWREWMGNFDLVISWLADESGTFRENLRACGVPHILQGPWTFAEAAPVSQQLAAALRPLGITDAAAVHRLRFPGQPARHGITVHPGSGSARKNWPVPSWQALLTALGPDAGPVTVITGEAESGPVLELASRLAAVGLQATASHGAGLVELCGLLSRSRLHLGHDTGISHLAAACGTPCALLYGPASPPQWEPPSPTVRVLRTSDMENLSAATVRHWLQAPLA